MNKALRSDLNTNQIRPDFIPARDYTGDHVASLEKSRLWPRIWHLACREEEIPNVGDFVNYEIYMGAVNSGMKSKGWPGAVTNPLQEIQISNFHKTLREFLQGQ